VVHLRCPRSRGGRSWFVRRLRPRLVALQFRNPLGGGGGGGGGGGWCSRRRKPISETSFGSSHGGSSGGFGSGFRRSLLNLRKSRLVVGESFLPSGDPFEFYDKLVIVVEMNAVRT
jgi:hypothetical protein